MAKLEPRSHPRGEVLFNDGDVGDCMHLLESGRLDVQITTPLGQTMTLRVVHPGEVVGELALVHRDHVRTGRVSALEAARTMVLRRRDFDDLRQQHPGIDRFLVGALAERLVRTSELIGELLQPPEVRIWKRLAVLADAYGDGPIHLSQQDLANAAGTVRQTANRVLQRGVQHGAIEIGRGEVRVLDRDGIDWLASDATARGAATASTLPPR